MARTLVNEFSATSETELCSSDMTASSRRYTGAATFHSARARNHRARIVITVFYCELLEEASFVLPYGC